MAFGLRFGLAAAAMIAAPAIATGPFDGTWKAKTEAAKLDPKPQVYELARGTYACRTCAPPYSIAADGAFHPIPDHPYIDEVAIRIVDPHTVALRYRKGGRETGSETDTVSADGTRLAASFEDRSAANGKVVTGRQTATRVAMGPPASHPYAGSWRFDPASGVSDAGLMFTLATDGDRVRYTAGTGEHYEAVLGGPYVPIVGDLGHAMVKMERAGPRAVRETVMNDGKVVSISTITLSPDGKSLTAQEQDVLHHTSNSFVAVRQ